MEVQKLLRLKYLHCVGPYVLYPIFCRAIMYHNRCFTPPLTNICLHLLHPHEGAYLHHSYEAVSQNPISQWKPIWRTWISHKNIFCDRFLYQSIILPVCWHELGRADRHFQNFSRRDLHKRTTENCCYPLLFHILFDSIWHSITCHLPSWWSILYHQPPTSCSTLIRRDPIGSYLIFGDSIRWTSENLHQVYRGKSSVPLRIS